VKFSEIVDQATALLQRKGRVSYRALKMEFGLDDDQLDVLKEELIDGQLLATDENSKVLVLIDGKETSVPWTGAPSESQTPLSYTPRHLAERILAEQKEMEARGEADGERKTITALFADLKGSTALIEGLDPEDARAIIDPALQLMMNAVHRYDGYVAQALGDGVFALFGAPIAHEDHPQRALYAALRIQEEMRRYSDELRRRGQAPLQTRVGVNTGEVVVRSIRKDDLHTDYVPVGHSTNIAARMEQLADPGSILVTEQTHKLTDGYFEFKALGETQVKGVEEPLSVFEVVGVGQLRTRLQVSERRGLSRFVGRHSEMGQLQQALAEAKLGRGQVVGVMGEPGLGKSRLFYEFKLVSLTGCLVLEANSVSHGKATAYLPVIELLKNYFRIEASDDERTRREKVTGKVLNLERSLEDALPYLFALLAIEVQPSPLQQMDEGIRRTRTFDALKRLFLRESLNQPLVIVFEDLHWIDGESQGLLDALSESVAGAKLLLMTNYRPEYRHDWGHKTYYCQLRLSPLGREEAGELLTSLLGDDERLTQAKALILEKTQGTPFFMEEVVQTLVEDGVLTGAAGHYQLTRALSALQLPSTVQAILAARIDRLAPDEKTLLQRLSVIGREFPMSLVRRVIDEPDVELHRLLGSLQQKEFLFEQPAFPEVEFVFKHALTQEVAYGTVLQEQRKTLHEQTAQAVESLYAVTLEDHYSTIAHHYSRSGNAVKAIEYLRLAGQQATRQSVNKEAIAHFTTALELLQTLPESPERDQQELGLQVALGTPLSVTTAYAAPEVGQVFRRARELCQQIGDSAELFPTLYGLWLFFYVRAEHKQAHALGEQLLELAETRNDPALLLEAHFAVGNSLFCLGKPAAALPHVESGSALYDPQQHHALAYNYGSYDPGVAHLKATKL
jgi:class 3 adenylate cyclase